MRTTRGFTLTEVMISGAILVTAMTVALQVLGTTSEHVADATIGADLRSRGHSAAMILRSALRGVNVQDGVTPVKQQLHPTLANQYLGLSYQRVTGFDPAAGLSTKSPTNVLSFNLESGETLNDVDDDGDGLVDEGTMFLKLGAAPSRVVAERVDGSTLTYRFWDSLEAESGATSTTPLAGAVKLIVSFTLQQRGRQLGSVERYSEEINIGIRNR